MSNNVNSPAAIELEVTPRDYKKNFHLLCGSWLSFLIQDQRVSKVEITGACLKIFIHLPTDTSLSQVETIRQRLVDGLDKTTVLVHGFTEFQHNLTMHTENDCKPANTSAEPNKGS